jgi:hypothetical protein
MYIGAKRGARLWHGSASRKAWKVLRYQAIVSTIARKWEYHPAGTNLVASSEAKGGKLLTADD